MTRRVAHAVSGCFDEGRNDLIHADTINVLWLGVEGQFVEDATLQAFPKGFDILKNTAVGFLTNNIGEFVFEHSNAKILNEVVGREGGRERHANRRQLGVVSNENKLLSMLVVVEVDEMHQVAEHVT